MDLRQGQDDNGSRAKKIESRAFLDVEAISGTALDFSRLGRTQKREDRRGVRSARREDRREEGREKI